jgi:PKD domain-containing protein
MPRLRFVLPGCGAVVLVGLLAGCDKAAEDLSTPSSVESAAPAPQNTPVPASPSPSPASNQQPRLEANVNPEQGAAPLEVRFNLCRSTDPDGDTLSYEIQFGDGGRSRRCQEAHTYGDPGRYSAHLSVTDGRGGIDDRTVVVTAEARRREPEPKPYYKLDSVGRFTWANELDVAEATAQVRLNEGPDFFPARGYSHGVGEARRGENLLSGRLLRAAGKPGSWRFDLGQASALAPGSLRVVKGTVEEVTASSITFRLSGRPDETVAFTFRASR